jgi:hypothetical protein
MATGFAPYNEEKAPQKPCYIKVFAVLFILLYYTQWYSRSFTRNDKYQLERKIPKTLDL